MENEAMNKTYQDFNHALSQLSAEYLKKFVDSDCKIEQAYQLVSFCYSMQVGSLKGWAYESFSAEPMSITEEAQLQGYNAFKKDKGTSKINMEN